MSPASKLLTSRVAGVALMVFALITTLTSATVSLNQRQASEKAVRTYTCQVAFNQATNIALKERAATRSEDADNLRLLVRELALASTHAESVEAMNAFVTQSQAIKAERVALPFPEAHCE